MTLALQITIGTAICALCAVLQILVVVKGIRRFQQAHMSKRFPLTASAELVILFAHLAQLALWAAVLHQLSGFESFEATLYFAIASYTTLGFGDVLLGEHLRVLGAMAAVAGLISFGISTAFLFAAVTDLLKRYDDHK